MLMTALLEYPGEALLFMWSIAFVLLALRVGRLRDLGRALKAPPTGRFLLGGAGWAFLFSSQYKDVSDVTTHMLVLTARTLVALAAMVVIVVILLSSR
jgi:hypothetical protein